LKPEGVDVVKKFFEWISPVKSRNDEGSASPEEAQSIAKSSSIHES
jgi:hypothetical protein